MEVGKGEYLKALTEILDEQRKAGIKLFTDGQLTWQDFLCYLATRIEGFKMAGLIRYFDNNIYYRMPRAVAKLRKTKDIVADEFKVAYAIEPAMKAVLSCFTLAKLSRNEFYADESEFIMDIARIMNQEAKTLTKNGAKYIQIDEPSLLYASDDDLEIAKDALGVIRSGVSAKFFLTTYFRGAKKIFPQVLDFDVDVIGLDFVEGYEENLELIKEYDMAKEIQAGVVDGRTTRMEEEASVRNKVDAIANASDAKLLYVSPNTGLEFLPYAKAREKLSIMCRSVSESDE